jgi:hypothetical protein
MTFSIEIMSFSIKILVFSIEILSFFIKILSFSIEIMSFFIKILAFSIEIFSFFIKRMSFFSVFVFPTPRSCQKRLGTLPAICPARQTLSGS